MDSTTREKRLKEIEQLKAKVQKKEAQFNAITRKERNGELMAFGILTETILKNETEFATFLKEKMVKYQFKDKNLERISSGIKRICDK